MFPSLEDATGATDRCAQPITSDSESKLLALPRELRDVIYDYLIQEKTVCVNVDMPGVRLPRSCFGTIHCSAYLQACGIPHVFSINRQINVEYTESVARAIATSSVSMSVNLSTGNHNDNPDAWAANLLAGISAAKHITTVDLSIEFRGCKSVCKIIKNLVQAMPSLENVTLTTYLRFQAVNRSHMTYNHDAPWTLKERHIAALRSFLQLSFPGSSRLAVGRVEHTTKVVSWQRRIGYSAYEETMLLSRDEEWNKATDSMDVVDFKHDDLQTDAVR